MRYQILHGEAFPVIECSLEKGEKIRAESDAMVAMDATVDVSGTAAGGILSGLARKFLSGESFFLQELVASRGPGRAWLAPAMPGGIMDVEMDGSYDLLTQKGAFLAATDGLEVGTKVENLVRGLFSGAGLFVVRIGGRGTAFVSSWGAVHALDVPDGHEIVIDNGHLVAWPSHMEYHIEKAGGSWFSSFASGEMLVCRFRGPGTVLIQTRNFFSFEGWVRMVAQATRNR